MADDNDQPAAGYYASDNRFFRRALLEEGHWQKGPVERPKSICCFFDAAVSRSLHGAIHSRASRELRFACFQVRHHQRDDQQLKKKPHLLTTTIFFFFFFFLKKKKKKKSNKNQNKNTTHSSSNNYQPKTRFCLKMAADRARSWQYQQWTWSHY